MLCLPMTVILARLSEIPNVQHKMQKRVVEFVKAEA